MYAVHEIERKRIIYLKMFVVQIVKLCVVYEWYTQFDAAVVQYAAQPVYSHVQHKRPDRHRHHERGTV